MPARSPVSLATSVASRRCSTRCWISGRASAGISDRRGNAATRRTSIRIDAGEPRSETAAQQGQPCHAVFRYCGVRIGSLEGALDLLEIDGRDLRRQPIEDRKLVLKTLLGNPHPGIAFNRHFDLEGDIVFHHACKLGCEGIVSKRLGSPYTSGRSRDWVKVKNPAAPAVKREAEEEWR